MLGFKSKEENKLERFLNVFYRQSVSLTCGGLAKFLRMGVLPLPVGIPSVATHSEVGVALVIPVSTPTSSASTSASAVISVASVSAPLMISVSTSASVMLVSVSVVSVSAAPGFSMLVIRPRSAAAAAAHSHAASMVSPATASSTAPLTPVAVPATFGHVDPESAVLEQRSVVLEGLLKGLFVVELDVAESFELVRLFVAH